MWLFHRVMSPTMQTEWQTVQTLIEEQSDLGLHCLPTPVCPKTWEHYGYFLCVYRYVLFLP